jgi:hypothetical protein
MAIAVVHKKPSVAEFESVVASVGFREHDDPAVEIALANSLSFASVPLKSSKLLVLAASPEMVQSVFFSQA